MKCIYLRERVLPELDFQTCFLLPTTDFINGSPTSGHTELFRPWTGTHRQQNSLHMATSGIESSEDNYTHSS